MKPKVLIGVVAIIGFTSLLFYNFGNSISTYVNFDQAAHMKGDQNIHVVGRWDKNKPAMFTSETKSFVFYMKDMKGNECKVVYSKPKPNNFDHAKSLVVIGQLKDGVFYADSMLLKCPSKYNADGDTMKMPKATS